MYIYKVAEENTHYPVDEGKKSNSCFTFVFILRGI